MYCIYPFCLTTDVAGGFSPSILDAQRMAVHASHALAVTKETEYQPIDYKEAFRLATLGGSKGRLNASTCRSGASILEHSRWRSMLHMH